MKKTVAILLMMCFLVTFGFAEELPLEEIRFRNIEWGCSIDEMYEQFSEISLTDSGKGSYMPYWERFEPGNGKDKTKFATGIDSTGWLWGDSLTVAGYPIQFVFADFMYDLQDRVVNRERSSTHFYMAEYTLKVEDWEGAFADLQEKLTSLYGEGIEKVGQFSNWIAPRYMNRSIVWEGANNTAVRLAAIENRDGVGIKIIYYKTDSSKQLKALDEAIKEEKVREEQESRTDSKDGL